MHRENYENSVEFQAQWFRQSYLTFKAVVVTLQRFTEALTAIAAVNSLKQPCRTEQKFKYTDDKQQCYACVTFY